MLPLTVSTFTVRVSLDFMYFVLDSIYILDCYHIFTRFTSNLLIVAVLN